ncbi:MAG: CRISPR-associated protein, Crm2 family [Candidatus Magnetoglobus multicellularis str. Araruama]|uniref:CRISPR-associated protein, Crm2 family n=1 Tax=Candidatus Magnetoglobus multicellularis str. Araruama TaxID=890399 RepID=A0A1V1P7H9_9BACT|nr:MAG: CRISPR-associated protein, Crm2 family [Candidatus Magnetoglobus multicellularis str. Araruama]
MKKYLVILQFGPVKDFIQTARRTDDYWAGSFLLSYAVGKAIVCLEQKGADIVFPDPEGNPLIKAARNDFKYYDNDSLNPSLPNRLGFCFSAETNLVLKEELNQIVQQLRDDIVSFFKDIEQIFSKKIFSGIFLVESAESQMNDLFEVYYAFTEMDSHDEGKAISETERRLAARKNIRDFIPFEQKGFKCTLCGVREPVRRKSALLVDIKRDWALINREYPFKFKLNEMLCAICTGKRLLRNVRFKMGKIPSTTTVAVSAWLSDIVTKVKNQEEKLGLHAENLRLKFLNEHIEKGASVPTNANVNHWLFNIEGDYFIDDVYDRLEKEAKDEKNADKRKALEDARKQLNKFIKDLSLDAPPKYYTIISFDGDNMGDYRKQLQLSEEHKQFSKKLAGFTQKVYQLIHQSDYHGYVIYSGGDEGVLLVPLSETLAVMDRLRKTFLAETGLTLSVGAAIVHHHAPLGEGLKAANEALDRAKLVKNSIDETSKNAFAFNLRKRSGAHMICHFPWEVKIDTESVNIIDYLLKWHDAYDQKLTRRWFFQVYKELPLFRESAEQSLFVNTLYQILPRHVPSDKKSMALSLAKETSDIMFSHDAANNIENLLLLLYIPIYLYNGGQD